MMSKRGSFYWETDLPDINIIKSKGKHIKSLRERGELIAQLYKYQNIEYVLNRNGSVFTRDFDNMDGITAALFPYKFNSQSLFRALRLRKQFRP